MKLIEEKVAAPGKEVKATKVTREATNVVDQVPVLQESLNAQAKGEGKAKKAKGRARPAARKAACASSLWPSRYVEVRETNHHHSRNPHAYSMYRGVDISVLHAAVGVCYSFWTNSYSTRPRHSFRPRVGQSTMAKNLDSFIPTRRSLLSRLKNPDDQDSWKDFFGIYWKLIYGVALKAGLTAVEAQEVAQETFIVVAKKMPGFKYDPAIGSFKSWLLHTTQWRISDQFRKRRKERAGGGRPSQTTRGTATMERIPDPAGFKLEEIWDAEWEKNLFDAALEKVKHQVKASHYQLFDLYVIKQWPVQKVAEALGVTIGQVYLAKHRISCLLKKELKELNRQIA